MPAPDVLQNANSWFAFEGFLAMAHSLSEPVFWERSLSTFPESCASQGRARQDTTARGAIRERIQEWVMARSPVTSPPAPRRPARSRLGLGGSQLAVLLVVVGLPAGDARAQHLDAHLPDPQDRVVGEEPAHHLAVRGAVVQPHPGVLPEQQVRQELAGLVGTWG